MTEIVGVVRAQLDALLELLEEAKQSHCRQAMDDARTQATQDLRRARRVARERVHRAVGDERERLEREVRLAAAGLETEQRKLARQRDVELIRVGWQALQEALDARWQDPEARRAWALAAVHEAGHLLLGKEWILRHPVDWPESERTAAARLAKDEYRAEVEFEADEALTAGLRVQNGGSLIDFTPAGLLAHERAVESELLAEVGKEREAGEGGAND